VVGATQIDDAIALEDDLSDIIAFGVGESIGDRPRFLSVRANMVSHPRDHLWSSYRVNAEGNRCGLITPNAQLLSLGATEALRRHAYRGLFDAHLECERIDDIRRSTNGNFILGDDRFKEEIATMLKRRVSPGKAGRPAKTA
jgi:putative transposase